MGVDSNICVVCKKECIMQQGERLVESTESHDSSGLQFILDSLGSGVCLQIVGPMVCEICRFCLILITPQHVCHGFCLLFNSLGHTDARSILEFTPHKLQYYLSTTSNQFLNHMQTRGILPSARHCTRWRTESSRPNLRSDVTTKTYLKASQQWVPLKRWRYTGILRDHRSPP